MPNVYFKARMFWRLGERERAISLLNEYIEGKTNKIAFLPTKRYFKSDKMDWFDTAVSIMLNDGYVLRIPFGQVFPILWSLDPYQNWIELLLAHDFSKEVDSELFEEEEPVDLDNSDSDLRLIANALLSSAEKGILGSNSSEHPNGGRPVLPVDWVKEVDDTHWGLLKNLLLDKLPNAFAACPPDFWERLALDEPLEVLERFLHDLFLRYDHPLDVIETRWKVIRRDFAPYASASIMALSNVLRDIQNLDTLNDIVRIDAGILSTNDGKAWLESLLYAMQTEDFSNVSRE